ncbi:ABC transporter ATP-binding protein/permease [Paenibacillus pasadenensis]|uniref:ABC transporter ATP-binding protein n=1 Tax=Paenibacillus pasadenensis TaxID=217090 RepID=UPI0020411FF2|nr:ABC transporter ATP-binding protein [Paenibacillus pasadenensis]MCM3748933.1 ABC transporter ATP-binding protein/permease [Paenibacillus pasadenensis]
MKKGLLLPYLASKAWFYAAALLAIAVGNMIQSLYPRVLGEFTDRLQSQSLSPGFITQSALLLAGIAVLYTSLAGSGQYLIMRLGREFERLTRKKLFRHFTRLSEAYYAKHGVGHMLSYVLSDVKSVREAIAVCFNQTANAVILLGSALVMMLVTGIPAALIGICISPLLLIPFIVVYFGPRIRSRSRNVQNDLAGMTESAEEQIGGMRVTQKFSVEPMMEARFGAHVNNVYNSQLSLVRMSSLFQALLPFLGSASLVLTLTAGGYQALNGSITVGMFVSLTLYIRLMINPLQQIGNVINTMQRSRASLERLQELLATRPDIVNDNDPLPFPAGADIRIQRLTYSYPGATAPALCDIDLTLREGRTTAIIGKTGSGKTTLAKLLLRMMEAPGGSIKFGDTDIRRIDLHSLRDAIAYVPQDGFLFSTTLRDNIAFARRDAEQQEIDEASRNAGIYEHILAFKDGFGTKLGERGVTLSGGQRQRTSLARGLIKQAPLLILDDSVSAVDAVTETAIVSSIRQLRRGKTTLIIAHRISALKHADEIIVLDEGKIVQRGTHESLLLETGLYAELAKLQQGGIGHGRTGA